MKRIANFIVERRIIVLIIVLAVTAVSGIFALQVNVNTDMTKYLPDDSSMKIGMDTMDIEFPEVEDIYTIRVMFTDLPEEEKETIHNALTEIEYVDEVDYEADNEDYNIDNYSLYIISTKHDFGTSEELALEDAISRQFESYDMVFVRDTTAETGLTPKIMIIAVVLLMVILFLMCSSWLEPFLFLIAIGVAIVVNMGTNALLGSISYVTASIAAILQLALSMDYSIILINRYRQELELGDGKHEAMKRALVNACGSIVGSAVTTIVGLLVMVFMSYKIGKDLGTVLAKGVFFSMLSVFTFLPILILQCDKWIQKTAKKVLHIKMGVISTFSYKFRYVITGVFVLLFIGSYFMQGETTIAYMMDEPDPIADVFTKTNTVVVLFDNDDDQTITEIAEHLESNEYVKSVSSVSTTIGKPYTSTELADEVAETDPDSETDLDAATLDILYYYYYKNGLTGDITTGDFLRFIVDDVANNATFEKHLDDEIRDNIDLMGVFADKDELTTPKTSAQIADLFDMDEGDVTNLFVYYFGEHGGTDTGTMTLPQFVGFIQSDVLPDDDFNSMIDEDTLDMIDTLVTLTNRDEIVTPKTAAQIAGILEMDASDMELLFMLYQAKHGGADKLGLTFPQFANLLTDDVLKDDRFEDSFDKKDREDIEKLSYLADPKKFQADERSSVIADALGMKPEEAELLYMFYFAQHGAVDEKEMKASDFVSMLINEVLKDERFQDSFDEEARKNMDILGTFGTEKKFMAKYSSRGFARLLDIKTEMADLLYSFYHAGSEPVGNLTAQEFVRFLNQDVSKKFSSMFSSAQRSQISMLSTFTNEKILLAEYTAPQLAYMLGIDLNTVNGIFNGATTMTLSRFIDDMANIGGVSSQFSMLKDLKNAALSGAELSYGDMENLTGMDAGLIKPLYLYHMVCYSHYTLPSAELYNLVDFITGSMGSVGGSDISGLYAMKYLMDAVLDEEKFTADALAGLIDMDEETAKLLYAYHVSEHGYTGRWNVSLQTLLDFVVEDVATGQFSDSVKEEDLKDLETARTLMQSTLSKKRYTAAELAELVDMDADTLKILYAYHINKYGDTGGWLLSIQGLVDFILDDVAADKDFGDLLEQKDLEDLTTLKKIMGGSLAGTSYRPEGLAGLLDIDPDSPAKLYLLYISRHGDTSGWKVPIQTFIHFIHDDVLTDEDLSDKINTEDADMLDGARRIIDSVIEGSFYSASEMSAHLDGLSDELNADTMKLLYVYYFSQIDSDPNWTFSINDFFNYLLDDIMVDPLFADVFDDKTRETLNDSKEEIDDAIKLLAGPNYSRMVISTTYPGESDDTYMFINDLLQRFDGNLDGNYYLIGTSAMSFEMSQSFDDENRFISLLTAISIFIVIAVTFHSLWIPAILVLVIQCGVYLTISIIGIQGYSIYYLALLIVQCILMGATIDYGILFTSYYKEKRETLDKKKALTEAYNGSIHTILTSGSIMILVTWILGSMFANPTIGQICQTISRGAMCATILIVFILPGLLSVFDRWVCKPEIDRVCVD